MASKQPTSSTKRSVQILWKVFFGALLFFILFLTAINFGLFGKLPSLKQLENSEADLASEIYSSDGKLMGKYYSENRSEVKYNQISLNVVNALIATEDERFIDHSGIDARAVARVVFTLGTQGGGSTLTQQLAKMMLDQGGRKNIIKRGIEKLKEWIVAVKLERNFTKEEIIALYLNRAPWGNNYGIRNAAITYFQKEPADLSIEEAAVLVGMLKGPSIYEPIKHKEASLKRRDVVIGQMANAKYITNEEAIQLKAKPLITNYKKPDENLGIAPYFRAVLSDKLKIWCKSHKNLKTGEDYDLYRDGLKIYTTIDSRMQQYAEDAVNQHMPIIQKKLDYILKINGEKMWKEGGVTVLKNAIKSSERWKTMKENEISEDEINKSFTIPVKMKIFAWNEKRELDTVMTPIDSIKYHKQLMQTSFVAMDPNTGEVKCWVGGIDFKWFKFDRVTTTRQVGSTFKPLLYTLAVKDAGYTPSTEIEGGTLCLDKKCITGKGGTLANGLAFSKNIVAYRLMGAIGAPRTVEFAHKCGIKSEIPAVSSIALGTAEIPMLEMLQSYTMFPNKGFNTEPIFLSRIEDKDGNVLDEFSTTTKQIISETEAYTMVQLMAGVVRIGTGRSLNNYGIPAEKAGKTGTTNGNTDGWFLGYTPELLAGTWVGCDDPFLKIYAGTSGGNEMALPKWGYFMNKVYGDRKLPYGKMMEFQKPTTLVNDPIYDEGNMDALFKDKDTINYLDDHGNGDASDFFDPEPTDNKNNKPDTGKTKDKITGTVPKPDDKKKANATNNDY